MRRFRTSLAGLTLTVCLGSTSLLAQTETAESIENQVSPVQDQEKSDDTPAVDSDDAQPPADAEVKPAVTAEPNASDSKTGAPQKTADAKTAAQQSTKSTTVPAKPGRFALTFDDLKFEQEKDEAFDRKLLTPKINSYHGGKVKIRGYIRPNFKQSGITKFIFVRDNKECCFGPQAAIFDNILVRLDKGESTNYTVRPVIVEGDFVLKEYHGPDGEVWSLYRMYNAEVK